MKHLADGEDDGDGGPRFRGAGLRWEQTDTDSLDFPPRFWFLAPFTEALLVGLLPIYAGKRIQWDARTMTATNAPEIARFTRKPYRRGFGLQPGVSLTRSVA